MEDRRRWIVKVNLINPFQVSVDTPKLKSANKVLLEGLERHASQAIRDIVDESCEK